MSFATDHTEQFALKGAGMGNGLLNLKRPIGSHVFFSAIKRGSFLGLYHASGPSVPWAKLT
jgi:hypothetical protein